MSSSPRRRGRSWGQRSLLMLNTVMIGAALGLAWLLNLSYEQVASIDRVVLGDVLSVVEDTEPGNRVLNILLVGYDSSAGLDPDDPINTGRQDEKWGDVTIILHIDEVAGTAAMLSIPRDLWVEVPGYGNRKFNFAYGRAGAELLVETIETEFDIPIHHYMSVDFAGFQGIVEAVDHVDVYFDQPARDWNEAANISQTGFEMLETGCQPLDPPTALAYVRSRYYQVQDENGDWAYSQPLSDIGRIQRQQDFIYRLISRAISAGARNPFTLASLIDVGLEQLVIDEYLTPQLLLDLGDTYRSFDLDELDSYSYPSDNERVETLWVLQPMEEDAEAILEIFRGTSPEDPSTVYLAVESHWAQSELGDELEEMLSSGGFTIAEHSASSGTSGLVLQYGPDGLAAAELVLSSLRASGLTDPVTLELVGGDPFFNLQNQGRSITLVVGDVPEQTAPTATTTPAEDPAVTENTSDGSQAPQTTSGETPEVEDQTDTEAESDQEVDACG